MDHVRTLCGQCRLLTVKPGGKFLLRLWLPADCSGYTHNSRAREVAACSRRYQVTYPNVRSIVCHLRVLIILLLWAVSGVGNGSTMNEPTGNCNWELPDKITILYTERVAITRHVTSPAALAIYYGCERNWPHIIFVLKISVIILAMQHR
jgi:hypothetical protein